MGGKNKGQNYKVTILIVVYSNNSYCYLTDSRPNCHDPSALCKGRMVAGWEEGSKDKIIR